MNLTYDRSEDILSIETSANGAIDHAEQADTFITHFSADGRLILLEILDASKFLDTVLKTTLRSQEETLSLAA